MSIVVDSVVKMYGEQKALDQVSFEIGSGEVVGFLGPNGAGKSTMMKIISGFIPSTSGTIIVNDKNIDDNSIAVRKEIGYLPENNPLYLDMYVREYLKFVAGIYKIKDKKGRIEKVIEQTGLTKEVHKKIGALSKGFRQRVGLAQALIHDPSVLILDEPTTGLDPNQIIEIRNLISEVGKEKTIMLSTHILQEVEAICDRVIIISNGQLVADDDAKDIISKQEKAQIIEVEFDKEVDITLLEKIEGVNKAVISPNKNILLECDFEKDLRSDVFEWAVANDVKVLSLQKIEKTLEEAFRELTS